MSTAAEFGLSAGVVAEVRRLAIETGADDPNEELLAAIRLLRIMREYMRSSGVEESEREKELVQALRLWLTVRANSPVRRIILDRSSGRRVSIEASELPGLQANGG